jgi:hypothetical protein
VNPAGPGDLPHTRVRYLIYAPDLVEVIAFTIAIVYGIWYLMPWDLFRVSSTYNDMRALLSEDAWGWIFIIVGVVQWYGWFRSWRNYRRRAALYGVVFWSIIWILTVHGNWRGAGTVIFPFSFIYYNLVAFLRLGNPRIGHYVNQ